MVGVARAVRVLTAFLCAALVACGDDAESQSGLSPVTSAVVSHETTQDIMVFTPDAEGPWPIVMALHGLGGSGEDMAEIATRLAREGHVVFAPTYRNDDLSTPEGVLRAQLDSECAYRFARSIAAEHGGDLQQPVTFVGWSLGATFVLGGGLTNDADPSVACFTGVPRPDVVVAISGCHYEFEGARFDFDPSGWGNKDADLVLVAGEEDTTCAAWQSVDAATALRSAGYDVDLVTLEGANHYAPIFHDVVDGEWVVVADDRAGERTVDAILTAIARQV